MNKDPRVDAFIEHSADFARPILMELRSIIEEAQPNLVETWKWSFPNYTWNGKIICSFSAFKQHCSFGFWLTAELPDPYQILEKVGRTAMGSLGKITDITQLPERHILIEYIRKAVELSENGIVVKKKQTSANKWEKSSVDFPQIFVNDPKAAASFDLLSMSQRKEYIFWIEEAKTEVTKLKRINTMLENLMEGKSLHWKYSKK